MNRKTSKSAPSADYKKRMESMVLQNLVLATLVYYDILNLPLTLSEICRLTLWHDEARDKVETGNSHLGVFFSPVKMEAVLEVLIATNKIEEYRGFYFLRGRRFLVSERIWRDKVSQEKIWRARRVFRFLTWLPFIQLVMISGSLALRNADLDSDYDLLIAVAPGRIWTARAFLLLLLKLIGAKREREYVKDKFCLNHFIVSDNLTISFRSVYNAVTYRHLIPIFEDGVTFRDFMEANRWIEEYALPVRRESGAAFLIKKNKTAIFIKRVLEKMLRGYFGDWLENLSRRYQKKHIDKNTVPEGRGRITISETVLEFHPASPEAAVIEKFNRRLKELRIEFPEQRDSGLSSWTIE